MNNKIETNLLYTEDQEWLKIEGNIVTIGITEFASKALGDLVTIDLPEINKEIIKGDELAIIDSVKAASDIYAPVSGKIVEINNSLADQPELVTNSPYEDGWFMKIEFTDESELSDYMDKIQYDEFCKIG